MGTTGKGISLLFADTEFKIKKRQLDEVRINVAASKEMLRKRKGINHTTRLEILEEATEVREKLFWF